MPCFLCWALVIADRVCQLSVPHGWDVLTGGEAGTDDFLVRRKQTKRVEREEGGRREERKYEGQGEKLSRKVSRHEETGGEAGALEGWPGRDGDCGPPHVLAWRRRSFSRARAAKTRKSLRGSGRMPLQRSRLSLPLRGPALLVCCRNVESSPTGVPFAAVDARRRRS